MISILGLSLIFFPLSYETRYERNQDQSIAAVHPQNYSGGVQTADWRVLFEYATYTSESGTAAFNIRREHRDLLLHGGYNVWKGHFTDLKDLKWNIRLGGIIGTYRESISTTLLGVTDKDTGGERWATGATAAASLGYKFMALELEGRPLFGQNYDPQPQMSYIIRLGFQIPIGDSADIKNKKPVVSQPQASSKKRI
ncbi:MAG: hypothetical protein V4736_12785 [Bdellovibrionota bacterium]